MLREEWEIGATDILERAREQADLFADAAHHMKEHGRTEAMDVCESMSAHRRRLAKELEAALRAHSIFPKDLDPEREAAHHLLDTVRSALSADEVDSMLQSRLEADAHLRESVAAAGSISGMPADLAALFDRYAEELRGDDARIDAFLAFRPKDD